MPCLKLSPLQSRFAASLAATLFIIIVLYFVLSNPSLAYAVDVDSIISKDHNHPRLQDIDLHLGPDGVAPETIAAPDSDLTSVGTVSGIQRRAPNNAVSLGNNAPEEGEVDLGATLYFWIPEDTLAGPKSGPSRGLPGFNEKEFLDNGLMERTELKRRNDTLVKQATRVYISATTCLQPAFNATPDSRNTGPPQLQLKVSPSTDIQQPDPGAQVSNLQVIDFDGGYASTVLDADGPIYISVSAPTDKSYFGSYKFEIAASIDRLFHEAESNVPYLFFVDSDSGSALLQTKDATNASPDDEIYQQWMNLDPPPFTMFAHDTKDKSILGVQNSYCGLKGNAQIRKDGDNVQVSMTNRGQNHKPKEQFYIRGLNSSTSYYGFLAMEGNSTDSGKGVVGGGGKVWRPTKFTTKAGTLI